MGVLANRIHQIAEFVGNELPDPSVCWLPTLESASIPG